ncbi:MAG: hypothetical protein V1748_02465 [Actinomycetota bacterium]
MAAGFSTLATASATLLGLVLVSIIFAYRSVFTRLDRIADFHELARWIWTSGFSCFMYFGACLLIAFRMMDKAVGKPTLVWILAVFSAALLVSHVMETYYLHSMARLNRRGFRNLVVGQDTLIALVLAVFEVMSWLAVFKTSPAAFELELYTALTYTLFLASFRSVALVVFSFRAITLLEQVD